MGLNFNWFKSYDTKRKYFPSVFFSICKKLAIYVIMIIFCYCPKHCFRLIEGQQYLCWSEKSPAVRLEPPTLGIQGRHLHLSSTEPFFCFLYHLYFGVSCICVITFEPVLHLKICL